MGITLLSPMYISLLILSLLILTLLTLVKSTSSSNLTCPVKLAASLTINDLVSNKLLIFAFVSTDNALAFKLFLTLRSLLKL